MPYGHYSLLSSVLHFPFSQTESALQFQSIGTFSFHTLSYFPQPDHNEPNIHSTTPLPLVVRRKMAHHYHHQHPKSLLDSQLYCSEDHWEEEEQAVLEEDDYSINYLTTTTNTTTTSTTTPTPQHSPLVLLEQDLFWDNEELTSLLSKEHHNNKLYTCLQTNPSLAQSRVEAVEWMLKVHTHYSFSPLTAVLAVNYLDRFLFSFRFQNGKPIWLNQLAAVACLSLAAKMEETQMPLSIDLQVCWNPIINTP